MTIHRPTDAILFDLDGTLTDSGRGIQNSVRYALSKMGRPIPPVSVLRKFVGPPLTEAFAAFCGMTAEEAREALSAYREYYRPKGMLENEVYKGVPAMLDALRARGERLFLATSKPEPFARQILDHFELTKYFDFVGAASLDASRADKPQVIRHVLDSTGVCPKRCLMVGDRFYDVEGAALFGMPTLGVLWGYGDEAELRCAGAVQLARTPMEVLEVLYGDQ